MPEMPRECPGIMPSRDAQTQCSHYPTTACLFGWRPNDLVVSEFLNVGRRRRGGTVPVCRGTVPVTLASMMASAGSATTSIFAASLAARISTRTVTMMMRPFLSVGFVPHRGRASILFVVFWPRGGWGCSVRNGGRCFILWRMIVILHWTTASIGLLWWHSVLKIEK